MRSFPTLFFAAACLAQSPSSVQVQLSLANEKTVYKTGEPILLQLTFTSGVRASVNITTTDPASPIDRLALTPTTGVFAWLNDQNGGHHYYPDYAAMAAIEPGRPQTVELPLNAVYRFDTAGRYSVYVVTNRIEGAPLTTNTVSFDIEPMTNDEETARASELERKIRAAGGMQSARGYAEELDWLSGDPSTRVKLALVLHPKEFYPFGVDVTKGLWIARNRALVVEQLEKALADPAQDLSAGSPVLQTAIELRARLTGVDTKEIERAYLKQIMASVPNRRGDSLLTAAQTAFTRLAARNEVTGEEFAAARETLITHFAEVNEYNVDWLLNTYGKYLLDPRIVPALKGILANQRNSMMALERTAVIRQLVKIAPQDSRAEVLNEVCSNNATLTMHLDEMPFATLPETDDCLQRKIHAAALTKNPVQLQWPAAFAARFADAAIFDDLFALYQRSGTRWDKQARGFLLAYLMRWNSQKAMPLLEAALPRNVSPPDSSITYALGRAGYIPGVDAYWRECLAGSLPELAWQAAYEMSQSGPAEDQPILRTRLDAWREQWKGREIPPLEGRFEGELTQAVIRGAHWETPQDEAQSLTDGCLSETCQTRFANRH